MAKTTNKTISKSADTMPEEEKQEAMEPLEDLPEEVIVERVDMHGDDIEAMGRQLEAVKRALSGFADAAAEYIISGYSRDRKNNLLKQTKVIREL